MRILRVLEAVIREFTFEILDDLNEMLDFLNAEKLQGFQNELLQINLSSLDVTGDVSSKSLIQGGFNLVKKTIIILRAASHKHSLQNNKKKTHRRLLTHDVYLVNLIYSS
jgi:hypothetical protein